MAHFTSAAASPRARSEDRAVVWSAGDAWIVVVADGTGGATGGAAAAEHVIAGIERAVSHGLPVADPRGVGRHPRGDRPGDHR